MLKRIMNFASRPGAEFNRHEALEMVDSLKNAAHDAKHEKEGYYRLVYDTLRAKLTQSDEQFRQFLFPLLGDKDHEKVLDLVAKVEKKNAREYTGASSEYGPMRRKASFAASGTSRRCFYCRQSGHFQAQCYKRKRDQGNQQNVGAARGPWDDRRNDKA
jgi:hypothetical protein